VKEFGIGQTFNFCAVYVSFQMILPQNAGSRKTLDRVVKGPSQSQIGEKNPFNRYYQLKVFNHLGYRFGINPVKQVIKKGRVYSVDMGYYRTA
jgi:hypothetical protein